MSSSPAVIDEVIPTEYRNIAEQLFPAAGSEAPRMFAEKDIRRFADLLGVGTDCADVMRANALDQADHRLLGHFRNNVELLIQKTWVEKADEFHKEKLLERIPLFVADVEAGAYRRALATFVLILDELAYLLFGSQSRKGDFIEYTFRIDGQIGLFWWYAGKLSSVPDSAEPAVLRSVLMIGICFLAAL